MSDETESIEDVVGKLVQEYLELGSLVDEMETQQDQIKDKMSAILRPGAEGAPSSWVFPTGEVSWVKGRKSERLDQGVLRKALVLAGVDVALVDEAFSKAVTVSQGNPHFRIAAVAAKGE